MAVACSVTRCWKKVAHFFQKLPKNCHTNFYLKSDFFKIAQKVTIHLGYVLNKTFNKILLRYRPIWSHWLWVS